MRLTLLGSGNAAGMPVYGCDCARCQHVENDARLQRGPASALLTVDDRQFLLDAGHHQLRQRFTAGSLDGIFITHFHADHVQGLFDLRWGKNLSIPVYCPPDSQGCDDLYKHPGILQFNQLKKFTTLQLDGLRITPLPLIHSRVTFGYLFEYQQTRIAYLTDTRGLPPKTLDRLMQSVPDYLVIDTSSPPGMENAGHNNLDDTLQIHHTIRPGCTVLTHISHAMDIWLTQNAHLLPENVQAGYDGLALQVG